MEATVISIIRHSFGASSLGPFAAAASERGLVMVEFLNGGAHSRPIQDLRGRYPEATVVEDEDQMGGLLARVADLIEHPEQERLPIDMRGSDFELRVWTALRDVPAGTTVTYGDIAARIGAPKEAREVGEACAANVLAVVVPCHRVVRRDGLISGYRWGVKRKRDLLNREAFGCFSLAS
jgi:AraC family transcriptional regulator, regulatory protein of adaptative response / methylated-DNA-[protein]-cysteine methyltransferase